MAKNQLHAMWPLIEKAAQPFQEDFRQYCRALAARNRDLGLDPDDIENTVFSGVLSRFKLMSPEGDGIPEVVRSVVTRPYLFKSAFNYVAGQTRKRATQTRALSLFGRELDKSMTSAERGHKEDQSRAEVLARILPRIEKSLKECGYFKSACFMLRVYYEESYPSIANTFFCVVHEASHELEAASLMVERVKGLQSQRRLDAMPLIRQMAPSPDELAELRKGLAKERKQYWHYGDREFARLRYWKSLVLSELLRVLEITKLDKNQ